MTHLAGERGGPNGSPERRLDERGLQISLEICSRVAHNESMHRFMAMCLCTFFVVLIPVQVWGEPDDDLGEPGDDEPIFDSDPGDEDDPFFDPAPPPTPLTEQPEPDPKTTADVYNDANPSLATLDAVADGSLSFGQLGEDYFLTVQLGVTLTYSELAIRLNAPIRLRMIDNPPSQGEALFRDEDFDEVEDYLRWIRVVQWAHPGDDFYVRLGDLRPVSLGHGTLMNNYLGTVSLNHFQPGLHTQLSDPRGDVEAMVDNLIGPEIFGLRGAVRPYAFVDEESAWSRWTLGTSFVADIAAPAQIRTDATTGAVLIDEGERLSFDAEPVYGIGFDTDFPLLVHDLLVFTPYADLNLILSEHTGVGIHAGARFDLAVSDDTQLALTLEYQNLSAHYLSQYFDTLYELQRLVYPSPAAVLPGQPPTTKKNALDASDERLHGVLVQLSANIMDFVQLQGVFKDYEGNNNTSILLHASTPGLSGFTFGALYTKAGVEPIDIFSADGAMMELYARTQLVSFVDVVTRYSRTWHLITDPNSPDYGTYQTQDEWSFGLGTSMAF